VSEVLPEHVVANLFALSEMTGDAHLILIGEMQPQIRAALHQMFSDFHTLVQACLPPESEIDPKVMVMASITVNSAAERLTSAARVAQELQ
jgi:hypothetical protein